MIAVDDHEPLCRTLGPGLFQKVKGWLYTMWVFDEPFDASIVALFIFMTRCYRLLPSVFYLFVMGKPGSGKSKLLITLCLVGKGLNLGDITAASMARELGRGREVRADSNLRVGRSTFAVQYHCATVDELDKLGKDQRMECEGILRNGYTWNGTRFMRCEGEKHVVKAWDLYMPKAMAATSGTEIALGGRGFRVSAAEKMGPEAYLVMLNNRWTHGAEELNAELDEWADAVNKSFTVEQLEVMERSSGHADKVKAVIGELGATRPAEHIATCVTISQLIGIDITEELKHSVETISLSNEEYEDEVAAINDALLLLAKEQTSIEAAESVTIKQVDVMNMINKAQRALDLKPISSTRFKEAYRLAGIKDSWIRNRGNRNYWVVPLPHLRLVEGLVNLPNLVNLPEKPVQQPLKGNQVDQVSLLHEDADNGVPYSELVEKYGLEFVQREKIPICGGRPEKTPKTDATSAPPASAPTTASESRTDSDLGVIPNTDSEKRSQPKMPQNPVNGTPIELTDSLLLDEAERQEARLMRDLKSSWPFVSGLIDDYAEAQRMDKKWGAFHIRAYAQRFKPTPSETIVEMLANDAGDTKGYGKTLKQIATARNIRAKREAPQ